jgi:hypothetical protein
MTEGFRAYNDNNQVLISSDIENMHYGGQATYVSSVTGLNEVITGYTWDTVNWAYSYWYSATHTDNSYPNTSGQTFYDAGYWSWAYINQRSRLEEEIIKNFARTSGCCIHTYTFTSAGVPLVFIRPDDYNLFYAVIQQSQSGTTWTMKVLQSGTYSHPPELHMFVQPSQLPPSTETIGLQVFLDDGTPAFDSRLQPLAIIDGGSSMPPTAPCDGGIPTESPYGNNYGDYDHNNNCIPDLHDIPNRGPRFNWGYKWLDFDFKSDTTYTTSDLTTSVTPNKLMFSAPSLAQAVSRRMQHGWSVSIPTRTCWFHANDWEDWTENHSTAMYWAMHRNAYRIRPAVSTKTRKIFFKKWKGASGFSWPSDTPTGASVGDLWISLCTSNFFPCFLYEWTEDSEWVPKPSYEEGWAFTMSDWYGASGGPYPENPNEGDMFTKRLSGGEATEEDLCWRYQGGSWVNIRQETGQSYITDTISTGSGSTTSIESGWAVLDSGYSYNATFQYYYWIGDNTQTSTSFGNMPYLPKTINLSNNAFLIADVDKYT